MSNTVHQFNDKAEPSYQRGNLLDKRRRLMADWAKHCAIGAKVSDVTPIRREAMK